MCAAAPTELPIWPGSRLTSPPVLRGSRLCCCCCGRLLRGLLLRGGRSTDWFRFSAGKAVPLLLLLVAACAACLALCVCGGSCSSSGALRDCSGLLVPLLLAVSTPLYCCQNLYLQEMHSTRHSTMALRRQSGASLACSAHQSCWLHLPITCLSSHERLLHATTACCTHCCCGC